MSFMPAFMLLTWRSVEIESGTNPRFTAGTAWRPGRGGVSCQRRDPRRRDAFQPDVPDADPLGEVLQYESWHFPVRAGKTAFDLTLGDRFQRPAIIQGSPLSGRAFLLVAKV